MKQIIGSPAEGDRFYPRLKIRENFFKQLDGGSHIQVTAPRRVGKTSVLLDLQAQQNDNYYMVYVITESIGSGNNFFQRLIDAVLDSDTISNYGKLGAITRDWFKGFSGRFKSISIKDLAIDLSGESKVDYFEEFKNLLKEVDLQGKKIVLMVDEFPITIENIKEKHGVDAAVMFLKQCREIRQDPKYREKVSFIYTGSIGLFSVVKAFNATSELNDLFEIKVSQLTKAEAREFSTLLIEEHGLDIEEPQIDRMLGAIHWLIPFHIQLLVKEVKDLYDLEEPELIDDMFIDKAFRNLVKNGDMYFDHYRGRLGKVFTKDEILYINELLKEMAEKEYCSEAAALDMATKYGLTDSFRTMINSLEYDGYIVETEDETGYQFYSPIIKAWWKRNG